jgi:hypothetical protein
MARKVRMGWVLVRVGRWTVYLLLTNIGGVGRAPVGLSEFLDLWERVDNNEGLKSWQPLSDTPRSGAVGWPENWVSGFARWV